MTVEQTIRVVQMAFPQVYLACHTRHERKRSTEERLSQRDSAILAHLDEKAPTVPSQLARHMGIARSTLALETKRLHAALATLDEKELGVIAAGLGRLAAACRAMAGDDDESPA